MSKQTYAAWAVLIALAGVVFTAVNLSFTKFCISLLILSIVVLVWRRLEHASRFDAFQLGAGAVLAFSAIALIVAAFGIGGGTGISATDPQHDPPHHAIARVPTICTIRGIPDSGYLNATLTGTTKSVVAVAVWIVDDHHWYFKPVRHEEASWSAPPDPTHLWEVGQPRDPSHTTFIFAMLARSKGAYHQPPAEGDGRRTIPDGFRIVGEQVALTKRELLAGGFHRRCEAQQPARVSGQDRPAA